MKQILLSFFFLLIVQGSLCAQERTYITETDDYIAWQPGVKLTFDMFKCTKHIYKIEIFSWERHGYML